MISPNPGELQGRALAWIIEARVIDDYGQSVGFWQQLDAVTLTMATTTPQRLTKRYDVEVGRYQVRVWRSSASTISGAGAQDGLYWAGLKALNSDSPAFADTTTLALRLRADATSSTAVQEWYVRQKAVLPHFDLASGDIVTGPTEAIDAAVLDIIRAEYGIGLDDDRIDLPALEELAGIWAARGDVCCTAIESNSGAWDVLEQVLAAGRARPQFVGAMITFVRDQARVMPTRLITQADMVRGSFEVERAHFRRESPNVVTMRYRDREGVMRTLECKPEGVSNPRPATVITQVMVDAEQVWREGHYMAATNNLRRRFPGWIMLAGGRAIVRGDLIEISHPRPGYGQPAKVVRFDWPEVELSAPVNLAPGATGWLKLSMPDGGLWGPVKVVADGDDERVVHVDGPDFQAVLEGAPGSLAYSFDPRNWMISEDLAKGPVGGAENLEGRQSEPTRAVIGTVGNQSLQCIVLEVTPREDGQVEVLAVEEVAAVHTADQIPLPATAEPAPALTNDAQPSWLNVIITGTEITDVARPDRVDFDISGPAVPGAVGYLVEWASSVSVGDWQDQTSSTSPAFAGPSVDGVDISIRVAATGPILRGPWQYFRTQINQAVEGISIAISEPGPEEV